MNRMYSWCLMAIAGACAWSAGMAQPVKLGAGTYYLSPRGDDKNMPAAPFRTEAMRNTAVQTSQWYSNLIFQPEPTPIYAQPLTVMPTPAGLEMALPSKQAVTSTRRDVEIRYPHADPLQLSPVAFEPGKAKLAKANDWSIDISMARGADEFMATVAHGSPFVSLQLTRGDVRLRLPAAGERTDKAADPRVLALLVKGKSYALFAPTGATWEQVSPQEWVAHLPSGKGYLSAAALPDATPQTLALFAKHAYAFIQDTRVDWRQDGAGGPIETTFKTITKAMEGSETTPLVGLYPHHWFKNASVDGKLGAAYDTVRGQIKLLAAAEFKTRNAYPAFVPYLPGIKESPRMSELEDVMKLDKRNARRMLVSPVGESAYWHGLGIQRIIKLMDVVEQQGDLEGRDQLLKTIKTRAEETLSGESKRNYFVYDKTMGAVAGYPDEFFTVAEINDHHFHYGYWIRSVAEIALRDPAWAAKDQWGGMIDLLVADIATAERGRADFPFLRNFDPYEGHSWAAGLGGFGGMGNNNESSSEAINAWAGLILWGEVTGNSALRNLGMYLMATEANSIQHYWFDIHGLVFPPEYKNVEVSQVWGGQYIHNTWWTESPREIKGINLMPITTASLYLATDPKYVKRNLDALKPEMENYTKYGTKPKNPPPADIWQDTFDKYLAMADPDQALAQWQRWGSVNLGDTRSHALHWMLSLKEMGLPDFTVTADTPLYSVFARADGRKTYLAFNATANPITVRFSDGKQMAVEPRKLGRLN